MKSATLLPMIAAIGGCASASVNVTRLETDGDTGVPGATHLLEVKQPRLYSELPISLDQAVTNACDSAELLDLNDILVGPVVTAHSDGSWLTGTSDYYSGYPIKCPEPGKELS